ncbi:MAG: dihydropteroate synthase [Actinomycetota bacterium]
MLNVEALVELQQRFPGLIDAPVAPFVIDGQAYDTDATPVVMGVVNLSRDSTYRESIALTFESAVRKARVQSAEGAHVIDIGAESSRGDASRVDSQTQIKQLVPVIEALTAEGIATSVESYDLDVVRACLAAGAGTVNMTSRDPGDEILAQVAEAGASVVMCFLPGEHARDGAAYDLQDDPIPQLHDYFAERVASARALGVTSMAIDPGLGFFYGPHVPQPVKQRHQGQVLLHSFRLRDLGVPICQLMPHGFDFFEDRYRAGEPFFTVLARLGGVGIFRVHEVPEVVRVLRTMNGLSI